MSNNKAIVKPVKTIEYTVEQSKYPHIGHLPTRAMLLGPSGQGKSTLLVNMILDFYRGCFSRIYIFSPSIHIDGCWLPVKKYLKNDMKQDDIKDQYLFDEYNEQDLIDIIDTQYKVIDYMKTNGYKKLYQILIIIDDFSDSPKFTRNSKMLSSLFIRGRHLAISTILSTQVFKAASPIIRKNITDIYVFRLRNQSELNALLEELSAIYSKEVLLSMYEKVISQPFHFLYINLMAKKREDLFYDSLQYKLIPSNNNINADNNNKTK